VGPSSHCFPHLLFRPRLACFCRASQSGPLGQQLSRRMQHGNACRTHFVAIVNGMLMLGRENGVSRVSRPQCHWQLLILERMTPPFILESEFVGLRACDKATS
jgi:hypothetical protein